MDPKKFVKFFKDGVYKPASNIEKDGNYLQGNTGLARAICDRNLVSLDSRAGVFNVAGLYSKKGGVVHRNDDGSLNCNCNSTGFCHHRLAVLQAVRMEVGNDKFTYNRSKLTKKSKGFKSGTKGPVRRAEFLKNVNPAPDADTIAEMSDFDDFNWSGEDSFEDSINEGGQSSDTAKRTSPRKNSPIVIPSGSDDDEFAQHHYRSSNTQNFVIALDSQSVTSRRSLASEPTTPTRFLFGNIPEEDLREITKLLGTSMFTCLNPKKMLMDDKLDNMLCFLIKEHG